MNMSNGIQPIVPASTLAVPSDFGANLSPDALMVYLSTRLNGLDAQINTIFNTEKSQQNVQTALRNLKQTLQPFDENGGAAQKQMTQDQMDAINAAIDGVTALDPQLGANIRQKLEEVGRGLIRDHLAGTDVDLTYSGNEVKATNDYIDGLSKDIESSSQMNMIQLQSLMSARQTAIQLSTNLISALGESSKAIASNIGR